MNPSPDNDESSEYKRQADEHLRAGRLDDAARGYRQALSTNADYVDACVGLGFVLSEQQQYPEAVQQLSHALSIAPDIADAHYILGTISKNQGDGAGAIGHFTRALDAKPDFEFAFRELIAALIEGGKVEEAKEVLGRAIATYPESAEFRFYLGNVLSSQGDHDDAIACFRQALSRQSGSAELHKNLADALRMRGQLDLAAASYQDALSLEPENCPAQFGLGLCLHSLGRLTEAESRYRRALVLEPESSEPKLQLAVVLQGRGSTQEVIQLLFDLATKEPDNPKLRNLLCESLRGVAIDHVGERERNVLLSLCTDDRISTLYLNTSILALIKKTGVFQILQNSARRRADLSTPLAPEIAAFLREPLLLAALPRMSFADIEMEEVFAHLRRCILRRHGAVGRMTPADLPAPAQFIGALARQCFLSGYAYFADDGELARMASLREGLEVALRDPNVNPATLELSLAVAALYDSLHTLQNAERLVGWPATVWSESFRPILQEQIGDRMREREIAARIPSITDIDDRVSLAVRSQYEENPYPRWVTASSPNPETIETLASRLRPGQAVRTRSRPVPILVAGCGTGHHPVQVARAYPDSEILAVDLSLASLAYAARMTERLGISNITYQQADILELASLNRRFDIVECGGVLHHLEDPMAGWRVLVELLEADGLMNIALYSEKARGAVRATREFIQSTGFPLTPEGMRRCRRAIVGLPDGHPAKGIMTFVDFFPLDEFRDLVMHVQEHQFTVPRIAACLDQLGMQFLGFECDTTTRNRFREKFPEAGSDLDLDAWDRFECAYPDTFRGMYSFWCCRK
jgi:tetratricopeptide (TPR) repeat protein/SAM-dependent methyltransferase